jgi:osmotically-inducible protein OsmY
VSTNKTDSQLKQDVICELSWDTRIDETTIGVAAHLGVITLTGIVSSWAEKHAAEQAAQRVAGVLDIANDIEIKPSWDTTKSDADIAVAVRNGLRWNVFVPDKSIKTSVSDHAVTLTGTVRTLTERDQAERVVREVEGVRCVENQLFVETPRVAETTLHAEIKGALERHVAREADRISVRIDGDTVILDGTVESWAERRAVLGAAKGTLGVRRVDDRLRIE